MTDRYLGYARTRATLAGGTTGVTLSALIALPFFGMAGSTPYAAKEGLTPVVIALMAAPGVLTIASIVAFPTSAFLVWLMSVAAKKSQVFDNLLIWAVSGCALSLPGAWLFGQFERPNGSFELNYGSTFILAIAACSALAAWLFRKRTGIQSAV